MQYSSTSSPCSSILCLYLVVLFLIVPTKAVKLPPNVTVPALIAFGDSIIDPGNNNNRKTVAKANFPPYGKDFMGGFPSGRFSNGRIPTDIIAEALSIKEYVPAYADPSIGPQDLLTGVSFASGASGYDLLSSQLASAIPLSVQLEQFQEYVGKLKQLVGEERTQFIVTNSVYLLVIGTNDIANTYFGTPIRRKHYDIDAYTNLMTDSASSFLQDLYQLGARRIAVLGTPPIGCVPSQRTLAGGIMRNCDEQRNQAAQLFNSKLSAQLDFLTRKLPNSRVVYVDIYDPILNIIQYPDKYGFKEVLKGCCGTGLIEATFLCNKFDPICLNDSEYLFWDAYHPTERGYFEIIDQVIDELSTILLS